MLIGYNVAALQIAGQTLSLALTRAILLTMGPLLLIWTGVTFVALVYLMAPLYLGQLWQTLLWFGAVVLFMIAYLWNLPWRLSGEYAARWAIRNLRGKPLWPIGRRRMASRCSRRASRGRTRAPISARPAR